MKILVTHASPDWDAIGAVWLVKKFLPGWGHAVVEFVPAGQRSERVHGKEVVWEDAVEKIGDLEVIHVDTGLGPLDHHQTDDQDTCATSLAWEYVRKKIAKTGTNLTSEHIEAISRIVRVIIDIDHFREVFWKEATADYQEFSLLGVLEGLKIAKPEQDTSYVEFGIACLEALVHNFENRIWAEKEIAKGLAFTTKYGRGLAFQTTNDSVLKLAQKMGALLVVRKDPRKGYVRIKVRPAEHKAEDMDLTVAYEKLQSIEPEATWFLHVSKKMLLNGTPKNPKMVPSKLSLQEVVKVLEEVYS